jgi:hypothetical protein
MVEGNAALCSGGGLPVVGVGGSLMTDSAGSITTQSIEFKYVMASDTRGHSIHSDLHFLTPKALIAKGFRT